MTSRHAAVRVLRTACWIYFLQLKKCCLHNYGFLQLSLWCFSNLKSSHGRLRSLVGLLTYLLSQQPISAFSAPRRGPRNAPDSSHKHPKRRLYPACLQLSLWCSWNLMSGHGGLKLPFTSDKQRSSKIPPQARNAMISNWQSCHRGLNQSIASDKRPCNNRVHITSRFCKHVQRNFCWSCLDVWMTVNVACFLALRRLDSLHSHSFPFISTGLNSSSSSSPLLSSSFLLRLFSNCGESHSLHSRVLARIAAFNMEALTFPSSLLLSPPIAQWLLPPFDSWTKISPIYYGESFWQFQKAVMNFPHKNVCCLSSSSQCRCTST